MGSRVGFELGSDAVGVVTLDRPDRRNALDWTAFEALHDAAGQAAAAIATGDCRAVLLRGAGPAFCAGLDVSLFVAQAAGAAPDDARIAWLQRAFTAFEDLRVPVVAAVQGAAVGAGLQLALAAHLRMVAADARLGLLEVRWGLVADLGATLRLPRLVGLSRATDLAISGRLIDAQEALAWGLVDAALPQDGFGQAARACAARLATGPTVATGALPGLLRAAFSQDRDATLAAERAAQAVCLASGDFAEAVRAAAEGRPPSFRGR